MPQLLEDGTRRSVAAFLPYAVTHITDTYKAFMAADMSEDDSKKFAAKVNAGKVALAHLELLLKLAKLLEGGGAVQEGDAERHSSLLEQARAEIMELERLNKKTE